MYRLFIDEVGHDNLNASSSVPERHLSLMGVVLNGRGHADLKIRMDALKVEAFGTSNVCLHRRELIDKRTPPFDKLNDMLVREKFDAGMMALFEDADYTALTVQVDKQALISKYPIWRFPPYHYCLTCMVERYVMWLKEKSIPGRIAQGDVMVEWRGVAPNMRLERSYTRLYRKGSDNVSAAEMRTYLSSAQIKIEKKEANIAGLQLADLLANPASRYMICRKTGERMTAPFSRAVMRILLSQKFRRGPKGRIDGYGLKVLP